MDVSGLEDLDRSLRDTEDRLRQVENLDAVLAETTARFTTADRLVSVKLGSDHTLVDLRIEPQALRLPSLQLAAKIKEAFAGAHDALREAVSKAMSDVLGDVDGGEVMRQAKDLGEAMTETLSEVTRSLNDAIVAASGVRRR